MPNQNARYAAIVAFGKEAGPRLDRGQCPRCGKEPKGFRDAVSAREHGISGLCQNCQDAIFREE
jgi:hypothetical protein